MSQVELRARCTTCRKVATLTPEQVKEARELGCAFSACCHAVATVEQASVDLRPARGKVSKS